MPFAQLSQIDRDTALQRVRYHDAAKVLAAMIKYPRGPDRRLTVAECEAGIRVELIDESGVIGVRSRSSPGAFE